MLTIHLLAFLAPLFFAQAGVGHDSAAVESWKTVALCLTSILAPIALAYSAMLYARTKVILATLDSNRRLMERVEVKADKLHELTNGGAGGFNAAAIAAATAAEKLETARIAAERLVVKVAEASETNAYMIDVVQKLYALTVQMAKSQQDRADLHADIAVSKQDRADLHAADDACAKDRTVLHTEVDRATPGPIVK